MAYRLDDTIAAVASAPGGAARGIVRISGADACRCVAAVFQPADPVDLASITYPMAIAGSLGLNEGNAFLPCWLYLWPTAKSFTGEPTAEIHAPGSMPLLEAVLRALGSAGARVAEPGEFTLRAFFNGRLDLTQAEAVLGAVDAVDSAQLDVALDQLAGGLAEPLRALRDRLVDLLAHLEAGLDFADEELPSIAPDELDAQLARAHDQTAELARRMQTRHTAGDLLRVVLTGRPNTGKSSLFNALIGSAKALVSDQPATTRDYLTAELDCSTLTLSSPHQGERRLAKCLLIDTAGIEPDPASTVRRVAQEAASQQSRVAHVEIFCLDGTRPLDDWERARLTEQADHRLVVLTKLDAGESTDFIGRAVRTSSITGQGLDMLRDRLHEAAIRAQAPSNQVVVATAARCGDCLRRTTESLARARQMVAASFDYHEELVAVELRVALEGLGQVVGAVHTDDLLDRIFSRFCIGK